MTKLTNNNKIDLGRRIKYFRKRADMSQLELETSAGLAAGVISRIESNQVNPNKETILAVAKALNLSEREIDYMIGITALPATEEEIEQAKIEAADMLNKKGNIGYLLDDRWRFIQFSKTFIKSLKMQPEELEYIYGRTTAQTIVEKDSPAITKWIDKDFQMKLLNLYLPQYYSELSYMDDDPTYQKTVKEIMANPLSRPIWENLVSKKERKYTSPDDMVIHFNILGLKIPLYYQGRQLTKNSRFWMVEYHTGNKILDMLPALI